MSHGYVIEFQGRDVGLVVRQPGERVFRFHAAQKRVHALDGDAFATPAAAHKAVARHLSRRTA